MLLEIHGLSISKSDLSKAENNDSVVTVDIIANHLTEDIENETVLKEAFNAETVKEFLDIGVIDFWHESKNPATTKEEKNAAILGKPIAFRWEKGLPVVTAELTKGHPRVAEMLPHLEAKQPVYSASIGGSKVVLEAVDAGGKMHKYIPKIRWDHLALAPANQVINRSPGMNVRMLQKAQEVYCEFENFGNFARNVGVLDHEEALTKALMAPSSVSDMSETSGGAVTKQSLEGAPSLTFDEDEAFDLLDTVIGIRNKTIPLKKAEYMKYFKDKNKKNFAEKSSRLFDKYFKLRKGAR